MRAIPHFLMAGYSADVVETRCLRNGFITCAKTGKRGGSSNPLGSTWMLSVFALFRELIFDTV